jgi:site-specific recombinase XerD
MPAATGVEEFRAFALAGGGPLARALERLEAAHAPGVIPTRPAAEVLAWAAFLALVRGHRGATTVALYVACLHRFLAWLHAEGHGHAKVPLSSFDAWQKWLRLTRKHSVKWQGIQVSAVRNFYDWRHTRGMGPNCARDLRHPRDNPKPPRKYSTQQLRGMLQAIAGYDDEAERVRDTAIVLFLLATGARREELVRLDLDDLELGRNTGMVRLHGKGAKERDVPFEGPVVTALREWLLLREGLPYLHAHDAVFVSLAGKARGGRMVVTAVERRVRMCARTSGMRKGQWGVHRFRVTFATLLYDGDGGAGGAGIEEIRRLLGHESIETTRRYIDVSERARKTRLSATAQHVALGTRNTSGPRWLDVALGGGYRDR